MFKVTGRLDEDSVMWAKEFQEYKHQSDAMELQTGMMALKIADSHGKQWYNYLSENGHLPTTVQTIRNRMEYASLALEVINRTSLETSDVIEIGFQRLKDLKKRERLFDEDMLSAAMSLSGHDFKQYLKEFDGQEIDDNQVVVCPVCHKRTTIDKLDPSYVTGL